jgi:hypothetical protein
MLRVVRPTGRIEIIAEFPAFLIDFDDDIVKNATGNYCELPVSWCISP